MNEGERWSGSSLPPKGRGWEKRLEGNKEKHYGDRANIRRHSNEIKACGRSFDFFVEEAKELSDSLPLCFLER